mgnify:FL=1
MFFRFGGVAVKRKLKKIVAIICAVCTLSTLFALSDLTVQIVQADAIGVGEFSRIFSSLSGALGSTPKGSGSKFWGNMMDMYGHSFDIWCKQYSDLNDKVQSWNNLLLQDVRTFTDYMIRSFPHFMSDVKSGIYDEELGVNKSDVYNEKVSIEKTLEGKKVVYSISDSAENRYCVKLGDATFKPTLANIANFGIKPDTLINSVNSYFSGNGYNFERYLEASVYLYVDFISIAQNADSFLFYNADNDTLTAYSENNHLYGYHYMNSSGSISAKTYLDRNLSVNKDYYKDGKLWVDTSGNAYRKGVMIYTNLYVRIYEDGSALIYDPARMSASTFDTIQNSLWDQISKSGTAIEDWAIADENGKTIDDPTSKILDKIYNNMLTADDIKALENGDTSVLEKLQGITAVNEKNGETVGDIKEDVNDAVGILGAIKLIGKRIFSRQLTLINLVKNLAKGKWTSVIDNVGDLTFPIVKSIDSIGQVVSSLSSMKWVIDNVGDICNPIGAAIDTLNGNIAGTITNVGNVVKGAIDNIKTADLTSVIDNVKALPRTIASSLQSAFESVKSAVNSLAVSVGNLFVPTSDSMNSIKVHANTMLLNHFNVDADDLSFNVSEKKFKSVKYQDKIIVDAGTMNAGIEFMRPFVQGLCWFFLILFALNQIIQLFDKKGVGDSDS